jgi:hypothetical protein
MSENDASSEGHLLPLQLYLKARFSAKDALDVPWTALSGFVANIAKVHLHTRCHNPAPVFIFLKRSRRSFACTVPSPP